MRLKKLLLVATATLGVLGFGGVSAFSQTLPAETFLSTRHLGLGGTTYVDYIAKGRDDNPALLFDRGNTAFVKGTYVQDDILPDLRMGYLQANTLLGKDWALEVAGADIQGQKMNPFGNLHLREDDLGVQVAHRVSDKLTVGFGTAWISTSSQLEVAGLGGFNQKSRPASFGGRLGVVYHPTKSLDLEATYDSYKDRETTTPYGLIATVFPETSSQFKTKKLTLGGVYRTKYAEINIFHTDLDISGGAYQFKKNFWHGGVRVPVKRFDLYGGLYDGRPSYGIGYHHGSQSLAVVASKQNQVFSPTAGWSYYAEYSLRW